MCIIPCGLSAPTNNSKFSVTSRNQIIFITHARGKLRTSGWGCAASSGDWPLFLPSSESTILQGFVALTHIR